MALKKFNRLGWDASFAVVALIVFYGCASNRPTIAMLRNTELEIRAADDAQAAEFAPVDLKNARDKLARAQQAMAAERYGEARRLAERAQVDAELAQAKAEARLMRRTVDQIFKNADNPSTAAEFESRKPLAPPPNKE